MVVYVNKIIDWISESELYAVDYVISVGNVLEVRTETFADHRDATKRYAELDRELK